MRVPELVPIRYGRMSASPFAFYRGAAYVMASDLDGTPQTGIQVQLCGDAHLANFGGFASAERQLLFDLVDFDETLPGPWEWDVKRLAASAAVAGRDNGYTAKRRTAIVRDLVGEYRQTIRQLATMKTLDVWYASASVSDVQQLLRSQASESQTKRFDRTVAKGRRKDSARAFAKLAVRGNGEARIRADPPLIVPIADLVDRPERCGSSSRARNLLESYLRAACRVIAAGCSSAFGTPTSRARSSAWGAWALRCWVILLLGRLERRAVPPGKGSAALRTRARSPAGLSSPTRGSGWSRASG